jgi:hypothetical protein
MALFISLHDGHFGQLQGADGDFIGPRVYFFLIADAKHPVRKEGLGVSRVGGGPLPPFL